MEGYNPAWDESPGEYASVDVPWYSGLSDIITSVGTAAQGILQTQQGVVVDRYGRIVSVGGEAVTNYAPTGTLGGLIGGMSITTLLLLVLGTLVAVKIFSK